MSDTVECIVIGGGIVGISIARQLALSGHEVVVLEAEPSIAAHTSSRNSEVIHAGIYYAVNSLKARLCTTGREMLYAYCKERSVPFSRLGKIIIATERGDVDKLSGIAVLGRQNGVTDLRWLDEREVADMEPSVRSRGGLYSPSTGIVDTHALIEAMAVDLESANGLIVCNSLVGAIEHCPGGFDLLVGNGTGDSVRCRTLINAAGLWAQDVASSISRLQRNHIPPVRYAKAHYYSYQGRSPFRHLVYPVPSDGGLGVHATLDMAGSLRFGPDVEWVDKVTYEFDDSRRDTFANEIRRYFPDVEYDRLQPGYTGVRPKLSSPGQPAADFAVQFEDVHGIPGLVNLFGIESPGITASLALARLVADQLGKEN